MKSVSADDRIAPPLASDEAATLLGFLNDQQDTLRWYEAVKVSDTVIAEALTGPDGLGALSGEVTDDGQRCSLRWIVCHMIEEYARHNGHADLLRESIDASIGE